MEKHDIMATVSDILTGNASMMISNYEFSTKTQFYSVLLDKNEIQFARTSKGNVSKMKYVVPEKRVYVNQQPMPSVFLQEFKLKLNRVIEDLKIGRAKLYQLT